MHHKLLKVYKFCLIPPVGTTTHLAVLQSYYFGSLACTAIAFCEILFLSIIKSPVDHTSYKYCVLCMVKYKYFQYSPYILAVGHKSSGNCRNFVVYILHVVSIYSHIQSVHIIWRIGIKTNGNYRNFVIFTCFVSNIIGYVYSNTKTYTTSPLVWLVGCKMRRNYRNFDNVHPVCTI